MILVFPCVRSFFDGVPVGGFRMCRLKASVLAVCAVCVLRVAGFHTMERR